VTTSELLSRLSSIVGEAAVIHGEAIPLELTVDEGLLSETSTPVAVVTPATTEQVAEIVSVARQHRVPLTARGSATGLSGGCVPLRGGVVVSFSSMRRILEVDLENHVAVVQPGVSLYELDEAVRPHGLLYPVQPGEQSSSLGGNVATNAGGMRAVRYGVTRQNVLGLEMVLGTGETVRSGGKFVKSSSGYDLTQLVIGSEGTLALVTEVTVKLQPRLGHTATVLAPFATLREITAAISPIVGSGLTPSILEYIDTLTMQSITASEGLDLAIAEDLRQRASAFLVVVLEQRTGERLEHDLEALAELLAGAGALDVFVLPGSAAASLVRARERAFYVAKAAGADEIVDVVLPRARIADFLEISGKLAAEHDCFAIGCGHAGDGNIHLSVFQPSPEQRESFLRELFSAGVAMGGAISGEHGIGTAKQRAFLDLESPARLALMRRVKSAFDPDNILNPDKIMGTGQPEGDGGGHLHDAEAGAPRP
jgi:glycolate oxidase